MIDYEERFAELKDDLEWLDGWVAQVEDELTEMYDDPELEDDTSDERFALMDNLLEGLAVWRKHLIIAIDVLFEPPFNEWEEDVRW